MFDKLLEALRGSNAMMKSVMRHVLGYDNNSYTGYGELHGVMFVEHIRNESNAHQGCIV